MRKSLKVLLLILLLIPFNCFALTKYTEKDAMLSYYIDDAYWTQEDLSKEREYINKKWTNDCGTILTSTGDFYSSFSEEDLEPLASELGMESVPREFFNFNNLFSSNDIAELIINSLNTEESYNITQWDYYDSDKVRFIRYTGTLTSSGITLDTEGYITINNGYLFTIAFSKYSPVNTVSCEKPISEIVDTVSTIEEDKVSANDSFNFLGLTWYQLLLSLLITVASYMIVPFILVVILKKKYDRKSVRKMALWNSICVGVLYLILTISLYKDSGAWSAAPAFLYYYINCAIWVHRDKNNKNNIEESESKNIKEEEIEEIEEIIETEEEKLEADEETIDNNTFFEAESLYKSQEYDDSKDLLIKYINEAIKENKNAGNYTTCNNMLEFSIYCTLEKPKDKIIDIPYYINTAYLYLGMIEYEYGNNEQAIEYLNKGLKYNPVDTSILLEKAENYKVLRDMKKFYDTSNQAYKYTYTKLDLAKYYRNLGYYYIEKRKYELAKAIYLYSLRFDKSPIVNKELEYIISKSDDSMPAKNRLENILSKNNIPLFISEDVINVILKLDKDLKKSNNSNSDLGEFVKELREELDI